MIRLWVKKIALTWDLSPCVIQALGPGRVISAIGDTIDFGIDVRLQNQVSIRSLSILDPQCLFWSLQSQAKKDASESRGFDNFGDIERDPALWRS